MNHLSLRKKYLFFFWWTLGFLFSLWIAARPTQAQQIIFEDDFSGGLEKWKPTRDDGTLWQIVDGEAEAFIGRGSTITELVPKDEYWNNEWKNISYKYQFTPLQGLDKNNSFGWENASTWFEMHFTQGRMRLTRREGNFVPINLFKTFAMRNGITYQMEIRVLEDKIAIFINGDLLVETTENFEHGGGRIGIKAGTGSIYPTRVRYDNIVVTLLDEPSNNGDTTLPVPLHKQSDPRWAHNEYDHGVSWSETPTIERWGCLVSSIAMVMNYHGITSFTDGTPLNPATLNNWLRTQPDGYVGQGLVMWSAVTRLTHQLSAATGKPKLEYSRITGNSLEPTINAINNQQPTILEVEGHFVAGSGFTADQQDLIIEDPYYDYQKLSQHQSGLRSTRLLTPSFTDLSYLYLMHDPELQVSLTDEAGQPLPELESFTEILEADGPDTQQNSLAFTQLAKPESGTYLVTIQGNTPTPKEHSLQIFSYDDQANFTDLSTKVWATDHPQLFEINYYKTESEGQSNLNQQITYQEFRQQLAVLNQNQAFYSADAYNTLDQLAQNQAPAAEIKQNIVQLGCWYSLETYYYLYDLATRLN